MGIIRAAVNAVHGSLADQWLETVEPYEMGEHTVFTEGILVRKGQNKKGSQTISNGSVIHVYDNQFMMLVDGGKIIDYTAEPYMANQQVFVVANDSDISSQADLAGKIVEVQADSSAEAALKEAPELTATFKELLTTADYNTAFMDLEQGAVDAIAMDVIVAGYQIQQRNADFKILDDSLSEEEYGVGFKKGNTELRDKVQSTLEEMAEDGTLQEVSEKWFSKDVTTIGK